MRDKRLGYPPTLSEVLKTDHEALARAYLVILADRNEIRAKLERLQQPGTWLVISETDRDLKNPEYGFN